MGSITTFPASAPPMAVPGIALAYAEKTDIQGAMVTVQAVIGLSLTVAVPEGRRIRISAFGLVDSDVASDVLMTEIREGATTLAQAKTYLGVANSVNQATVNISAVISPSAGVHTYHVVMGRGTGTGTNVRWVATTAAKSYMLIEDITGFTQPVPPANVPVGVLAQALLTATQSGITTQVDLTGAIVNVTVPAGRTLRIIGSVKAGSTVTSDLGRLWIYEDGNYVQFVDMTGGQFHAVVTRSPAAGAHEYKLRFSRQTGTGTWNTTVDPAYPGMLVVEDITPTPAPAGGAPGSTLGYAQTIASLTGAAAGSELDIPGLAVTVTVPAGRRLRITASGVTYTNTVPGRTDLKIMEGATFLNNGESIHNVAGWGQRSMAQAVISPSAGAHTYKAVLRSTNQQGFLYADGNVPAFILIEDITGALWPAGQAVTSGMVTDDVPWTEVSTFLNSWVNYGAGFPTAAYRKIGKIVYLKGLLKNGVVDASAFTLPAGYVPANTRHFITMMANGAGGLRVNTSGAVIFGSPGGGGNGFCSLDGIHFETDG